MKNHPIKRLWKHIDPKRRRQFIWLLLLMIIVSLFEIVSIGFVVPFLGALTSPEQIFHHPAAQPFISYLELTSAEQLLFPLTIAFIIAALVAGIMRLILLRISMRLSFATGADLSINIYRKTLYQPYSVHISRNTSEVISGITKKTDSVIYSCLTPILMILSASIMLTAILITMLLIKPLVAIVAIAGFGSIYGAIIFIIRGKLLRNSRQSALETTQIFKALQEGLGGIRDVLLDGSQKVYCQIYRRADLSMRQAMASTQFFGLSPKYVMESLGMILIAGLAYWLVQMPGGIVSAIPILGAMALAAQRLLPILQQAYSAWSDITGSGSQLLDTLELLDQPFPDYLKEEHVTPLDFNHTISLENVNFRYTTEGAWVLNEFNIEILKGSRIGFIGVTGSGKSTLLDIFMGLLQPTEGVMKIDNIDITVESQRSWQKHIAHVPQNIFLVDSSIEENIAFGIAKEKIDHKRVHFAAEQAQIAATIEE